MASKAELLASARKNVQKQKIFRRGRGSTTSVRQPAVKAAGRDSKAVSDFLGTMLDLGPGVLDAHNREQNEENKKMVARGEAAYKNATPSQRKEFRDNIRSGVISGGDSPYFREGLKRSQADAMSLEYGVEVMNAWEQSGVKNNPDPEAFTKFLDDFQHKAEGPPGQNRSWTERVGDLGDFVANEEFQPKADAIKRQLMQMHSEHQRTEYTKKAQGIKEVSEASKLNDTSLQMLIDNSTIKDRLLSEGVQNDGLLAHVNMLDTTKRRTRNGNMRSEFMSNAYSKGMNKKDAEAAWVAENSKIDLKIRRLSEEIAGQSDPHHVSKGVFSIAAYKKEDKETQKDLKLLAGYKGGRKYAGDWTQAVGSKSKLTKQELNQAPPTLVRTLPPVEEAEKENLGLDKIVLKEDFDKSEGNIAVSQVIPSPIDLASHLRGKPAKSGIYSLATPSAKVESGHGIDTSMMTTLHGVLKEKQEAEQAKQEVATAKNEPVLEKKPEPKSVPQPEVTEPKKVVPLKETLKTALEGIVPDRTSYGVVAYNTKDEAEEIVDKIQKKVIGKETGGWELAIVKVGDLFQIQTQGGANVTAEQKAAFFNALSSEFPGEMGNIDAERGAKDWVQIIKSKGK